jgi:hypothetical protein
MPERRLPWKTLDLDTPLLSKHYIDINIFPQSALDVVAQVYVDVCRYYNADQVYAQH